VKVGDKVAAGDIVAIIEAMKMQNEIAAPHDGVVQKILSFEGEVVTNGDALLVISR
jgi:pyruvate carboxylase subunit B